MILICFLFAFFGGSWVTLEGSWDKLEKRWKRRLCEGDELMRGDEFLEIFESDRRAGRRIEIENQILRFFGFHFVDELRNARKARSFDGGCRCV